MTEPVGIGVCGSRRREPFRASPSLLGVVAVRLGDHAPVIDHLEVLNFDGSRITSVRT